MQDKQRIIARVTFLASPAFKRSLERQAKAAQMSVGALIRSRFDDEVSEETELLKALTAQLNQSVREARQEVAEALEAFERLRSR